MNKVEEHEDSASNRNKVVVLVEEHEDWASNR